jgi:hypothetical protein
MAQRLNKSIERETTATIFSRGQHRSIIVSLNPNNTIGLRLKGEKQTYDLPIDGLFDVAVKASLLPTRQGKRRN